MTIASADVSTVPVADLLSLAGRRAVETGGAQGLGKAIAFRPAEAGADVLVGDVNEDRARTSAAVIAQRFEVRAAGVGMDVIDSEPVRAAASVATEELGVGGPIARNRGGSNPDDAAGLSRMQTASVVRSDQICQFPRRYGQNTAPVVLPRRRRRSDRRPLNLGRRRGARA